MDAIVTWVMDNWGKITAFVQKFYEIIKGVIEG